MAIPINTTINEAQNKFLKEKGLSPSKLLQDAINKLAAELDPEMYQKNINEFTRKDQANAHMTKWQKALEFYSDDERKRKFINLYSLECSGIDQTEEIKNLKLSFEEMKEVMDKIKEYDKVSR